MTVVIAAVLLATFTAAPSPVVALTGAEPLTAPVIVSPSAYAVSGAPILEWRAVPGALRYSVTVQPNPPTTTGVCGGETETLRMTCDWIPPGPYTWTVRAVGYASRLGPPSSPRLFTKLPRPLEAPTITGPGNGAAFDLATGLPVLRWSQVPYAAYYQVQTSDTPTFVGDVPDPTYASTGTEGESVLGHVIGRVQYWRVRAVSHSKTEVSPWSTHRSYIVHWAAPDPTAPVDGSVVSNAILAWDPVAYAHRYEIEVAPATDPTFDAPILRTQTRAPQFDLGSTAGSFRWRVRAINFVDGRTAWSVPSSVTVDPDGDAMSMPEPIALAIPTMIGPADGAVGVDLVSSPLRWTPVLGTVGYDLQVMPVGLDWPSVDGQSPNFPAPTSVANLDFGVTYKWRVRANATVNVFRAGEWSEERTFTTRPRGTVNLLGPADGATVSYEDILLQWTPVPSAPIYQVELSRTPGFEDPVLIPGYRDGRITTRNALDPGAWYWRVKAGHDSTQAISQVRALNVVDDVEPAGMVGPPNAYTTTGTITVGQPAEDTVSEIARYAVSANGTDWEEWDYLDAQDWSLTTPEHGGPDPGLRTLWFRWRDTAGNWSTPRTQRVWYGPLPADVTPPQVTAPRITGIVPASSIPASGSVPIRVSWSGSDDFGTIRYELTRHMSGVAGAQLVLKDHVGPTTVDLVVPPQRTYRYTARGTDSALNTSGYAIGAAAAVSRYGETSSAITYKGSWASSSSSSFWGGAARRSMTAGSTASFTFTGRSVGLVALRASNRGAATIYVNGAKVATIDLYARSYLGKQVVWSMDWSTSAKRTVTVRVAGTAGRPRVDIDGFVVVR